MNRDIHKSATIMRLPARPDPEGVEQLELFDTHIAQALSEPLARRVVAELRRKAQIEPRTRGTWRFWMTGEEQHRQIMLYMLEAPRRASMMRLWAIIPSTMDWDTGEILRSRQELAEEAGIPPKHVSEVLGEWNKIGLVTRVRDGREYRYFVNPNFGTRITDKETREAEQATWPDQIVIDFPQPAA